MTRAASADRLATRAARSSPSLGSAPAACWTNRPTTMALIRRETSAAPARSSRSGRCVAHPRLNGAFEVREQVEPDRARRRVPPHGLAHHEADEVLDLEHGAQDRLDQPGEVRLGGGARHLGLRAFARGAARLGLSRARRPHRHRHRQEALLDQDGLQQIPLRGEVVVERRHVELGGRREVAHAGPVDASLRHQGEGDVEDPPARRRPFTGVGGAGTGVHGIGTGVAGIGSGAGRLVARAGRPGEIRFRLLHGPSILRPGPRCICAPAVELGRIGRPAVPTTQHEPHA